MSVEAKRLKAIWSKYLKLVDILDGIISENGSLPRSYWKSEDIKEMDDLTESSKTLGDLQRNESRIVKNFNNLLESTNAYISVGHSIDRYGSMRGLKKMV